MKAILEPLGELAEYELITKELKSGKGMVQVSGIVPSARSHMIYGLSENYKYKVILTASEGRGKEILEEIKMLDEDTYYYPPKDLLFYQADLRSKDIMKARSEVTQKIISGEPITVVTTIDGCMDALPKKDVIQKEMIKISIEDQVDLEKLSMDLIRIGYERVEQVEGFAQFAVRGGILDVFPLTEEVPIRVELWGDEIDSIRSFDSLSQRSIETLNEVFIYPADEGMNHQRVCSFLDYFKGDDTLLFLDEPIRLREKAEGIDEEYIEASKRRIEEGFEVTDLEALLFSPEEVIQRVNQFSSVGFYTLDMKKSGFKTKGAYPFHSVSINPYNGSFETLTRDLKRYKKEKYRVLLLSGSRSRAKRLAEDLRDYNLQSFYSEETERDIKEGEIMTAYGHIKAGYEYPSIKFIAISESDIFGRQKKKKKRKKQEGSVIDSFSQLKVGDYVVHENHGLGIYQGIEKIQVDRVTKDYMKITYAKDGNLYIPATQLDLIQKYASSDAKKPRLDRLGSTRWSTTKSKVKHAIDEIATDLVELYAKRQMQEGFQYQEDTPWQKEFEELFPFEETEDQLHAIEDVKRDMESKKIMDRLICGDVGYGKTEIAIRAAFKAVQEDKQVAYLVPTTILVKQHYNTFVQRIKEYPVRVEMLSRFQSASQQREIIRNLKKGLVDIIIGTHRILSKDIMFKDLGLLVIDEEQRFGVKHKEKIKQLKENVDVMTLTATPIPRTLHMSMIGIRDMSVLEEAPNERIPIQTYVMEYHDEMVREAIEREYSRGGQVYYVYNRVEDIIEMANRIQKLVPEMQVAYAHGQMRGDKLDRIMLDFINGEIDVLVSTTIIETGLDIPNVNTMIIHDADRFGLSQLYQLRGRVGRSNRMAYAFLLYQRNKLLKEEAEKRLAAIREFTDLGSGFKIAMRDLEIRGAGNLLGESQHGHMDLVGYDLYVKMLRESIKHFKGEGSGKAFTTTIDIEVDGLIPDTYIGNANHKLEVYKKIATIENQEDKEDLIEELIDRFGDLPKKAEILIEVALLKAKAHSLSIVSIEQKKNMFYFEMAEDAPVITEKIAEWLQKNEDVITLKREPKPTFIAKQQKKKKEESPLAVVERILSLIEEIME
ncbi:transcription-repair coupling factor (superfamily II helicase) [Aequitasia blattaphilus]|uniref:Transcription-repair-coupling factor n=1 Tax=Aequitasia blattaphilus TaxID=2949332 RepID=A0ABT1E655_9FIRM|nr:transcription-repair coupling factor [Aequitasia blattaphilus]MCP1101329.1 transcription-repair coupling factor [Aequitasia blattaphilus]MCR8613969.1 transcription-repair coupling factor [Aequitasia blattaphilus]